jgi:hypothetical protein
MKSRSDMSNPSTENANKYKRKELKRRVRGFMDGIDWQHHIGVGNDCNGATVYPSKKQTIALKGCLARGGRCGVVEVEIRLVRWVVPQRLDLERMERRRKLKP